MTTCEGVLLSPGHDAGAEASVVPGMVSRASANSATTIFLTLQGWWEEANS
ncbi:MAG: hypothetical protein M3285_07720 [Actinomycetota bacterium]|nr:hypothetical protein [Actinomycetota bacterium]